MYVFSFSQKNFFSIDGYGYDKVEVHQMSYATDDVGAHVFVGNLDPSVDVGTLEQTFAQFEKLLVRPTVFKDSHTAGTANERGYAFLVFADFDGADAAISAMNGQFMGNRQLSLAYALKKNGKGERHGSEAERLMAKKKQQQQQQNQQQLFNSYFPTQPRPF